MFEDQSGLLKLKAQCSVLSGAVEGGIQYYLMQQFELPVGCSPARVDALLCAGERDGYPTRLYFARKIESPNGIPRNWNANGIHILDRNWFAYSWKVPADIRLDFVVDEHLKALA